MTATISLLSATRRRNVLLTQSSRSRQEQTESVSASYTVLICPTRKRCCSVPAGKLALSVWSRPMFWRVPRLRHFLPPQWLGRRHLSGQLEVVSLSSGQFRRSSDRAGVCDPSYACVVASVS